MNYYTIYKDIKDITEESDETLIKRSFHKSDKKHEFQDNIKIGDKLYSCQTSRRIKEGHITCVSEIDFSKYDWLKIENEVTCPYCGSEKSDSWELDDEGEFECDCCGSEYSYSREVEVSYWTRPIKKNEDYVEL